MRRRHPTRVAALIATVALAPLGAQPAMADDTDKPPAAHPRLISFGGSGCKKNEGVKVFQGPDTVSLVYSKFTAEAPSTEPHANLRECAVKLALDFSGGWQWSVVKTRYTLNLSIAEGAKAEHTSRYFFEDSGEESSSNQVFEGPKLGETRYADQQNVTTWSRCGSSQQFQILNTLYAEAGPQGQKAHVSLDTQDTSIESKIVFDLGWRRC